MDIDVQAYDGEARAFFNSQNLAEHIDQVFDIVRVSGVVMTNDPFAEAEGQIWSSDVDAQVGLRRHDGVGEAGEDRGLARREHGQWGHGRAGYL